MNNHHYCKLFVHFITIFYANRSYLSQISLRLASQTDLKTSDADSGSGLPLYVIPKWMQLVEHVSSCNQYSNSRFIKAEN